MPEDVVRHKAKLRLLILLVVLALVLAGGWYLSRSSTKKKISSFEAMALGHMAQEIQKKVSIPAPLIATGTPVHGGAGPYALTREGIIAETNLQRKTYGDLAPLDESALLDKIAAARLADMATNQYFAHFSPSGSSAETVAKTDGYAYLALGENLALGDFAGDAGVVGAWMGSPGHRANILNTHYTQIGVAAQDIVFDGNASWLAVQVFGRPASDCPAPSPEEKSSLDAAEKELSDMAETLKTQQASLGVMSSGDPSYDAAISAYNALAAQYNALLKTTQANIAAYNSAVNTYNACLSE
jgi:uncharacterized protein YkwD